MSAQNKDKAEPLLTPAEAAEHFKVDPKTVTRWANAGLLPCIKTLGGHRRFNKRQIEELAAQRYEQATYPQHD